MIEHAFTRRRSDATRIVHFGQTVPVQRTFQEHGIHLFEQAAQGLFERTAEKVGCAAQP